MNDPAPLIRAHWFDGLSSQPRKVLVGLEPGSAKGPTLAVHSLQEAGGAPRRYAAQDVIWPENWSAKRHQERMIVDLKDGGSLEILDTPLWIQALQSSGFRPGMAQRMQTRWPLFFGILAVAAIGLVAFYRYGTPWAASVITRHVPLGWEITIADSALQQMDERMLKPSKLPRERQEQLRAEFESLIARTPPTLLRYHGYQPNYTLQFRRGMGANAFALPGGSIVVTDGLVEIAQRRKISDEAIIGVLAHEIGHVAHRHTTRMVVEQGVLNVGLGLALGDVSSIVATGSTLLTGLAYQRSHEREADCFAIALLQGTHIPTAPMGDLLLAMAAEQSKKTRSGKDDENDEDAAESPSAHAPASTASQAGGAGEAKREEDVKDSGLFNMLSAHPDTVARAQSLRDGHAGHCPSQP